MTRYEFNACYQSPGSKFAVENPRKVHGHFWRLEEGADFGTYSSGVRRCPCGAVQAQI